MEDAVNLPDVPTNLEVSSVPVILDTPVMDLPAQVGSSVSLLHSGIRLQTTSVGDCWQFWVLDFIQLVFISVCNKASVYA